MFEFLLETVVTYKTWSTIAAIISLILLYFSFKSLWKLFFILFTFTKPISLLKEGRGEIKGRVDSKNKIKLFNQKVVLYKKIIESKARSGWMEEDVIYKISPFNVTDDSGTILIKPTEKTLFLLKERIEFDTIDGYRRHRYLYLEENDPVYILGDVLEDDSGKYFSKVGKTPFIISNKRELKHILKYSLFGFFFLAITIMSLLPVIAHSRKEYLNSWEGVVMSKDSYGKGMNRECSITFEQDTPTVDVKVKKILCRDWEKIEKDDYVIKKRKTYKTIIRKR